MVYSDFQTDLSNFLRTYAVWICLGIVLVILLVIFFLFILPLIKQKKINENQQPRGKEWLNALGGADNIINLSSSRSRLSVELKDSSLVDKEKLKVMGASSIITMSQKIILVIDNQADKIKKTIEKNL
ncbi:MAG TPA: PTS transporter subunit EIIB [Bacilli bacterium]|nr:PTS transporter subunit EIIB [Bacilli bacterium]